MHTRRPAASPSEQGRKGCNTHEVGGSAGVRGFHDRCLDIADSFRVPITPRIFPRVVTSSCPQTTSFFGLASCRTTEYHRCTQYCVTIHHFPLLPVVPCLTNTRRDTLTVCRAPSSHHRAHSHATAMPAQPPRLSTHLSPRPSMRRPPSVPATDVATT